MEFSKGYFKELETTNHYVLELLKQVTQPIEQNTGIGVHRIFPGWDLNSKPQRFTNIWVLDNPSENEEPSFFLTDATFFKDVNKIAVINFKRPVYHIKTYIKQGLFKYKRWVLDEKYIKELIEFLNSPIEVTDYTKARYGKCVKINWQKLIIEYNLNTAGWSDDTPKGCGYLEVLPLDLPMPDYLKLLSEE